MASASTAECLECNGIKENALLSYVLQPKSPPALPKQSVVTNELILELVKFKDLHSQCTYRTLHSWLKALYGSRWPKEPPTHHAITRSIDRLKGKLRKLKKQGATPSKELTLSQYLKEEYSLLRLGMVKGRVIPFSPVKSSSISKSDMSSKSSTTQCK